MCPVPGEGTGGSASTPQSQAISRSEVMLSRRATGQYRVTNARGANIDIGGEGELSPVELLLAAIGGCASIDVDVVTARRGEADQFEVVVGATKTTDDTGGRLLSDVAVDFRLSFDDASSEQIATILPGLIKISHDKHCTVSRTVEHAVPVQMRLNGLSVTG